MNDARQELIAEIDDWIRSALSPDSLKGEEAAVPILERIRAALSADASATPVARPYGWLYEMGNESWFRREQYQPHVSRDNMTEIPLYLGRSIPQQDEPSTPVARQEEAMWLLKEIVSCLPSGPG